MAAASRRTSWLPAGAAAGVGLVAMGVLFAPEIRAAVGVWSASTAFGHCFLVGPIALWLAWERRDRLRSLRPSPLPVACLLVLPALLAWLFAERLGLMEGRQLTALFMACTLVPAAFGLRVTAAMAAPLLYLVFLVPFGAFLVPALQSFTAGFIETGLQLLAIPHYVDDVVIDIPEGRFLVAEACAGLRFLIAAIAFGALYALLIYRSAWRRLAFLAVSLVVPILANGVRALGIVLLGHALGSAEAGAVDHVVYGWLFFSLVIGLLIVLGLPFREDRAAPPPPPVQPRGPATRPASGGVVAVACVLGLSCLGPALAFLLDRNGAADRPAAVALSGVPPGCQPQAPGPREQVFACPGGATLRIRQFGPRAGAGLVQAELQAGEGVLDDEDLEHATMAVPAGAWRLSKTSRPPAAVATALFRGGRASPGGLRDRFALAVASLTGRAPPPLVATLSAAGPGAVVAVRTLAEQLRLPSAEAAR